MPHFVVQPLVYPYTIGLCWHCDGMMNISAWGFSVARFDYEGHVERPQNVKRARVLGFTSFLCINSGMIKPYQTYSKTPRLSEVRIRT